MTIIIKHYSSKKDIPQDVYKRLEKLVAFTGSAMHMFLNPPSWTHGTRNPRIYVAFDKNAPIAWTCHYYKYFNIFVKPKYRGKGIALRLTKRVTKNKRHHFCVHKLESKNLLIKAGITSKIRYQ